MHHFTARIYYEDTDAGGVVYYANYLKFAERARTEMLREAGLSHEEMRRRFGVFFVVRRAEVDYRKPARLDDEITVESHLLEHTRTSITMRQMVRRGTENLTEITVRLVCVRGGGDQPLAPEAIPQDVMHILSRPV